MATPKLILSTIIVCFALSANAASKKLCVGVPYIKSIALSGTQSVTLGSNQSWTVSVTSDYSNSNKAVDWSVISGDSASITNKTNTSATINGIKVDSNGTSSATIRAAATDGSGLSDDRTITVSCPTAGVSPAGGAFSAVSPYTSNTNCRYTAPSKTISGCYTVSVNTVSYSGSSWPASTYNVTANSGYYIQNNTSSSATCVACSSSDCTGSRNCTPTGCTVSYGTCTYATNSGSQTRTSTACTNGTGNTNTSTVCSDSWNTCSASSSSAKTVSCNSGYTPQNQGTSSASCVLAFTCSASSINSSLSSICNSNLICTDGCSGHSGTTGQNATFEATSCPSPSPSTVYGQSKCSSQRDTGYGYWDTPRPISGTPLSTNGESCWCRLCTSSARTTCGAWVWDTYYSDAAYCSNNCAQMCGGYVARYGSTMQANQAFRMALCKPVP